ncbi:MAG: hypothetical protein IPJ65_21555 [Archangiaceae bacterium]|nr:hypothetical protein [Archangiaceae bacterium]
MTGCLFIASLLAAEPEPWKRESAPEGVTLESRPVKDNAYYEYRAQADTDAPVAALCDAIFDWGSVSKDHAQLKARTLLEDHGEYRIVYDQLDPPVVSCRDFAFTVKRERRDDGSCRLDFYPTNEKAPASPSGWVRMEKLKGSWLFEPRGEGKTHVTYQLWADPAGAIPAVFVHGSQREAAVETLKKGIAKGRELQARRAP